MFKGISKTDKTNWDDISRRVYGLPDKATNLKKLNANISSGEILAPVNDTKTDSSETGARLEIGDQTYKDFAEYEFFDNVGSVRGAVFVFICSDNSYKLDFKNEVKVFDENGLFLTGRVVNISSHVTQAQRWVQCEVKSNAGVLVDSVCPYPLEYSNMSLRAILSDLAECFGQQITFSDDKELDEICVNDIGTSFSARPDERVFSFMSRLCRSRGFIIKDTGSGLFIGRLKDGEQEKISFIQGECIGVKEWHAGYNTDGLARYYELNSQYPDTQTAVAQVPLPYPVTKRLHSDDYNANDLNSIASIKACEDIGQHFRVILILNEERRGLKTGDVAIIKNPDIYIEQETEFIIKSITPLDNNETRILFVLPCAYTGIIPESLPLC